MERSEASVVEGLLVGFDATTEEEIHLLEWAKTPRTLAQDIPVTELNQEDKELLLSNAALLTMADGEQSEGEMEALQQLITILGFDDETARLLIADANDGALRLGTRSLRPAD